MSLNELTPEKLKEMIFQMQNSPRQEWVIWAEVYVDLKKSIKKNIKGRLEKGTKNIVFSEELQCCVQRYVDVIIDKVTDGLADVIVNRRYYNLEALSNMRRLYGSIAFCRVFDLAFRGNCRHERGDPDEDYFLVDYFVS